MQIILREWNALLRFHFWLISYGAIRSTPISHPLHGGVDAMLANTNRGRAHFTMTAATAMIGA
jgi:hypothetical protein